MSEDGDKIRSFSPGEVIIREGDVGDVMYVIHAGTVKISKNILGSDKLLAQLSCGEFFGEMSLLNHKKRTATATALDEVKVLELDWETFTRRIKKYNVVAIKMIQTLATRLDETLYVVENLFRSTASSRLANELFNQLTSGPGGDALTDATAPHQMGFDPELIRRHTGLDPEVLTDELERLSRLKLIAKTDDHITIISPRLFCAYLKRLDALEAMI